jgi:hypothetical protein
LIERPGDSECRIVPEDGPFTGRIVASSGLVEDLGGFRKDEEAVRKAFGYPEKLELAIVVTRLEVEGGPPAEVGRVSAKIDGDVPDVTGENADEFTLWVPELVMKAAEYTPRGKRLVILGEDRGKAERGEGFFVEDFSEPPACVTVALGLQNFYIAQGGFT